MKLSQHTEQVINKFAEMMIKRMEEMKNNKWEKGWIGSNYGAGPVNLEGVGYRGVNAFMLTWGCMGQNYEYPIFCTLKQANKLGARILKGAQSLPIIFWDFCYFLHGKKLSSDQFRKLPVEQQSECTRYPFLKCYTVFNIEQTNLAEKHPDKLAKLYSLFASTASSDDSGMYVNAALDKMLQEQTWLCPIHYKSASNGAYYSPSKDVVVVPKKSQFRTGANADEVYKDGQEYYATLIHELVHSTAPKDRLNRKTGKKFGDEGYATEELVAELGAARCGQILGFDKRILDNNAAYLDAWISSLRKDPMYIMTIMSDVEKASRMILQHLAA
jgi:antirestriction protein ArdC